MKGKLIYYAVLIFFTIGPGILEAEVMSLEDCINTALKHNKDIILGKSDTSDAVAEIIKSKSDYYPHLRMQGSYHKQSSHSVYDTIWDEEKKWDDATEYSLILDYYLYYGGLYSKKSIADLKLRGAKLNLHILMEQIRDDVISVFLDIRSLNEIKTVVQENLKAASEQVKQVKAKFDLGMVMETDLLKVYVDKGRYEAEIVDLDEQIGAKLTELNLIMGRSPEKELKLGEGLIEYLQIPSRNTAIDLMNSHNSINKFYKNEIQIAKKEYKTAKLQHMPTVRLEASQSRSRYEIEDSVENSIDSRIGIYVDFDIFSGFSKEADIKISKTALYKAKTQYSKQLAELRKRIEDNYKKLESLNSILNIYKNNLISAEKDFLLAKQLYKIGKVTILDVIDANRALLLSKSEIVETENEIIKTKVQIHRLIGGYHE